MRDLSFRYIFYILFCYKNDHNNRKQKAYLERFDVEMY